MRRNKDKIEAYINALQKADAVIDTANPKQEV